MTVQLLEHNFPEEMPASCDRIAYIRIHTTDSRESETAGDTPVVGTKSRQTCAF